MQTVIKGAYTNESVSFQSEDWKFVKAELEKQVSNGRDILENKLTTPEDTAFYRGRVALAKEILKLPELKEIAPATKTTR